MKQLLTIFLLSAILFSCNKNDEPIQEQPIKVIDKIKIKGTNTSSGNVSTNSIVFEYNANREISKITAFNETQLSYSCTFIYQNSVPVSSMYDFPGGGDPMYEVKYGYTNGKYSSYYDTYYNTTISFSYNEQFNQYTNMETQSRYIVNENDDIVSKTLSTFGNEYAYTFDITKKGPLYNVKNKKFIPIIWYGTSNSQSNEVSTFPVTSVFDDNLAQTNPYTNTYDTDGFVTKSMYTINNGSIIYEITYTYKLI